MKQAIAEPKALGQDKLADLGIADNLAFALLYVGSFPRHTRLRKRSILSRKRCWPQAWP